VHDIHIDVDQMIKLIIFLSDFVNWYYPSGVKTLYWDADNKRARETVVNQNKQPEDYYLLYQAPGSEPGSVRQIRVKSGSRTKLT
jgi:hypothetical protein